MIVVTHDTSLIQMGETIYHLDKGALISQPKAAAVKERKQTSFGKTQLSAKNALILAGTAIRRQMGRTATIVLSLLVAAALLLTSVSGVLTHSGNAVFDDLFDTYGDSLLDISLYSSFMSAGGTDGQEPDGPKADVSQNLDGLFERYRNDERVQHVLFAQSFNNIQVDVNGQVYTIQTTNNAPVFHHLEAGKLPMGDGMELVVPEAFVETTGMTNEEILGKEIAFSGTIFNWESGQPVETPVSCNVTVVGVADTTMIFEHDGTTYETPMGDSFFFSPAALTAMRENANMKSQPGNFYIRCKTPAALIAVKDELNAMGVVPLGQFELVEDMVRLSEQTAAQSGTAMGVIGALALVVALAAAILTALLRRREFAIYQISGFSAAHLTRLIAVESLLQAAFAALLFLALSPLLNLATNALWSVNILSGKLLGTGAALCLALGMLTFAITAAIAATIHVQNCLKTGEH